MNITDLLRIVRIKLADPLYDNSDESALWKTDELLYYINNAIREVSLRGFMIIERDTSFKIKSNVSQYSMPDNMFKLIQVIDENNEPLIKVQEVDLNKAWRTDVKDVPTYFIQNQPSHLRFYPIPTKDQVVLVKGAVYPDDLIEADELPDELNIMYHHNLLDWVLYECFNKIDVDGYDKNRGFDHLAAFNEVFGEKPSALQMREIQNYPDDARSHQNY